MKTPVNIQDRFIIIMAGGRGEHYWPVSRERTPKQLLKLLGERSSCKRPWIGCCRWSR